MTDLFVFSSEDEWEKKVGLSVCRPAAGFTGGCLWTGMHTENSGGGEEAAVMDGEREIGGLGYYLATRGGTGASRGCTRMD